MAHYIHSDEKVYGYKETENHTPMTDAEWIAFRDAPKVLTKYDIDSARIIEIDNRLNQIDLESVRPLRAINNQTYTIFDTDKLTALDNEAIILRNERALISL